MIDSTPRFLQGVFGFTGAGYGRPVLLDASLVYVVPPDKRAQLIYLRTGNSASEMAFFALMKDGVAMRLFPVGASGATHVPLAVVEDLEPDTKIEIFVGAPEGVSGTAVIDLGIIEV
jgi:assimilatory nitrate reductase catalytic subunit